MTNHLCQNKTEEAASSVIKLTERLIKLTNCISRVQTAFIAQQKDSQLLAESLDDLLAISDSRFGFIGEVWRCPVTSQPVLRFLALSNVAWSEATRQLYQQQLERQLEFRNLDTLFGYSLRTGETVISNDPASHPASRGLPHGYPPLNSYLGVPIYYQSELVAMVAVANKQAEYTMDDVDFLMPLLNTIGQLIYVGKIRQQELDTKKQLLNVLAAANAATWSLNTVTEELTVNARWAEMLGYHLAEITPVTLSWMRTQMHPEDLITSRRAMLKHFAAESDCYECVFRIRHKNGCWVWVHGRGQVLTGDEVTGRIMYGINMDVTEQRDLQQRFERVAALVPGAVLTMVLDGGSAVRIPYISEGIASLVPLQPVEIIASADQFFHLIDSTDLQTLLRLLETDPQLKQRWRCRFRLQSPQQASDLRWFELQAQAETEIYREQQRTWYCYMYDVTDLVQTEIEMQIAKEEAEKAATIKSAFVANMSHEIRTPMNGVIGMLDVLAEANTDIKLDDNIAIMRDSAYSLLTIIDDVLDFSKLEAGKLVISAQPCFFSEVIEQVFDLLDVMALRQQVEMHLYIDPALTGQFLFDPDRVRQIMVNLVSNAIKFSQGTGRDAKVQAEFRLIDRQNSECLVECRIIDNGIGIAPHSLTRLFKPFVQADDSTRRQYGGTGLGLSITQQLTRLMGGVISADSTIGQGTTFVVTLPLTETICAAHSAQLKGVSVCMLWQDNAPWLEYYHSYLLSAGATVSRSSVIDNSKAAMVWLIDSVSLETMQFNDFEQQLPKPLLLVGRGKRRKIRALAESVIGVDANCLKMAVLLAAVNQVINADERGVTQVFSDVATAGRATEPLLNNLTDSAKLILVAEDNTTNQKVIKSLLTRLGYQVMLAENGQQALTLAHTHRPDLILTDLHMPLMDGFSFMEAWRAEERELNQRPLPVIALTANISADERKRCLNGGFDDYLIKPLPMQQLRAALQRWLKDTQPVEPAVGGSVAEHIMTSWCCFASLRELVGDDELIDVLRDYSQSLSQHFALLKQACERQDYSDIQLLSHKLKSSSRFVGATCLADALAELESSAKHQTAGITQYHTTFHIIEQTLNAVNQFIHTTPGSVA
ncbi:MAG: response regulator [Gammaproteobacteria bacterium]|nr:response regulator [Gammaproteobacteria bacterium]